MSGQDFQAQLENTVIKCSINAMVTKTLIGYAYLMMPPGLAATEDTTDSQGHSDVKDIKKYILLS